MSDQPRQLDYATPPPRRWRPMMWQLITIGALVVVAALGVALLAWQVARAGRAESAARNALVAAQRARSAAQLSASLPPEIVAMATSLGEQQKIEVLINSVASATDITFIRNGNDHSSADAAAHLRRKYETAERQMTAREFIEHIASRSSMSGEEYRVRLPDGTEQTSGQWLTAKLAELEKRAPTTAPSR